LVPFYFEAMIYGLAPADCVMDLWKSDFGKSLSNSVLPSAIWAFSGIRLTLSELTFNILPNLSSSVNYLF
jgi:hypothetical protein